MVLFTRHELSPPGHFDHAPPPCSWDYAPAHRPFLFDLAFATCAFGHTCRIVSTVHSIDPSGVLSPSYVCTIPGCSFHAFVQFVGWRARQPARP